MRHYGKLLDRIINFLYCVLAFKCLLWLIIWFQFIRERLPSIIPYEMSLFGIILLSLICLSYVNSIYLILFPQKDKAFKDLFNNLHRIVQKPYYILCNHLYEGKRTRRYFITFSNYMIYKCNSPTYYKIFVTFELSIRLLISLSLFIDIFWFSCLDYFYKCLLLNMFLFLFSVIRYMLIFTIRKNINYMDERMQLFWQPYSPDVIKHDNILAHLLLDTNKQKNYKYAYLALYCFALFCWCSLFYFNLQVTSSIHRL